MVVQEIPIPADSFAVLAERDQGHFAAMDAFQARRVELKTQYGGYVNIPNWLRSQACNMLRSAGWQYEQGRGWFIVHNSVTLSSL